MPASTLLSLTSRSIATSLLAALTFASALTIGCDASESSDEDTSGGTGTASGGTGTTTGGTGTTTGGTGTTTGGTGTTTGGTGTTTGGTGTGTFGNPTMGGNGITADRWYKADVTRDGTNYFLMANGWGPNFQSQNLSYQGTSFKIISMAGERGDNYEPASYPTVFCGVYSDSQSGACGLPKPLTGITSLRTGWRWNPNGNNGQYNAAYDIWLSTSADVTGHSSFLMVWLRDPPGQQPAGSRQAQGITVANTTGFWNLWVGNVGGKPCISYVRQEGQDTLELEFDVMDFVRDVQTRAINMPGTNILSVAVGFEIWQGPITNLESNDFYVTPQ